MLDLKINFGGSSDALCWFRSLLTAVVAAPASTLSTLGMLLLGSALIAAFARHSRGTRSLKQTK